MSQAVLKITSKTDSLQPFYTEGYPPVIDIITSLNLPPSSFRGWPAIDVLLQNEPQRPIATPGVRSVWKRQDTAAIVLDYPDTGRIAFSEEVACRVWLQYHAAALQKYSSPDRSSSQAAAKGCIECLYLGGYSRNHCKGAWERAAVAATQRPAAVEEMLGQGGNIERQAILAIIDRQFRKLNLENRGVNFYALIFGNLRRWVAVADLYYTNKERQKLQPLVEQLCNTYRTDLLFARENDPGRIACRELQAASRRNRLITAAAWGIDSGSAICDPGTIGEYAASFERPGSSYRSWRLGLHDRRDLEGATFDCSGVRNREDLSLVFDLHKGSGLIVENHVTTNQSPAGFIPKVSAISVFIGMLIEDTGNINKLWCGRAICKSDEAHDADLTVEKTAQKSSSAARSVKGMLKAANLLRAARKEVLLTGTSTVSEVVSELRRQANLAFPMLFRGSDIPILCQQEFGSSLVDHLEIAELSEDADRPSTPLGSALGRLLGDYRQKSSIQEFRRLLERIMLGKRCMLRHIRQREENLRAPHKIRSCVGSANQRQLLALLGAAKPLEERRLLELVEQTNNGVERLIAESIRFFSSRSFAAWHGREGATATLAVSYGGSGALLLKGAGFRSVLSDRDLETVRKIHKAAVGYSYLADNQQLSLEFCGYDPLKGALVFKFQPEQREEIKQILSSGIDSEGR